MTTRKIYKKTKRFSKTQKGGHKRMTKRALKGGKRRIHKAGMGVWLKTKLKHYGIYDFNFNERFTITKKLKEIEHNKRIKERKIWTNSGLSENEQNKKINKIREEEKNQIIELLIKEVEKKHKHHNKKSK